MTHVDLRPRWLFILGFVLVMVAVIFGFLRATEEATSLLAEVKVNYQRHYGEPMNVGRYIYLCVQKPSCMQAYYRAWSAPHWLQALYWSALSFGVVAAAFSRVWKPELLYRRQVRVGAGRMEEIRKASAVKPRGTLTAGGVTR